jgi:hypothetical protein
MREPVRPDSSVADAVFASSMALIENPARAREERLRSKAQALVFVAALAEADRVEREKSQRRFRG